MPGCRHVVWRSVFSIHTFFKECTWYLKALNEGNQWKIRKKRKWLRECLDKFRDYVLCYVDSLPLTFAMFPFLKDPPFFLLRWTTSLRSTRTTSSCNTSTGQCQGWTAPWSESPIFASTTSTPSTTRTWPGEDKFKGRSRQMVPPGLLYLASCPCSSSSSST